MIDASARSRTSVEGLNGVTRIPRSSATPIASTRSTVTPATVAKARRSRRRPATTSVAGKSIMETSWKPFSPVTARTAAHAWMAATRTKMAARSRPRRLSHNAVRAPASAARSATADAHRPPITL